MNGLWKLWRRGWCGRRTLTISKPAHQADLVEEHSSIRIYGRTFQPNIDNSHCSKTMELSSYAPMPTFVVWPSG